MCLSSEFGAETVGRTGRGGVEITMVIFLRFGERVGEDACGEGGKVVRARFGEDSRVGDAYNGFVAASTRELDVHSWTSF